VVVTAAAGIGREESRTGSRRPAGQKVVVTQGTTLQEDCLVEAVEVI
jgi:hypothetical protein